jgi:Ni/Co efflux regulator RcnB
MKTPKLKRIFVPALMLAGTLALGPALAEKPSWAGDGNKGERHEANEKSPRDGGRQQHFEDHQRQLVRDYYEEGHRKGRCPPGLAKKHNGCMAPGQAKKWHVGQQLPRDVVYYRVPQPLLQQIGQPPSGYRYVRVASDILMMAVGSRMVVDAIQDLGRS